MAAITAYFYQDRIGALVQGNVNGVGIRQDIRSTHRQNGILAIGIGSMDLGFVDPDLDCIPVVPHVQLDILLSRRPDA